MNEKFEKVKNIVICAVMAAFIFGFSLLCLFMPKPEFLDSERREPAKFPELTFESIMKDGVDYQYSFMKKFDDNYTPDNFPFRDTFRSLKGFVVNYVFNHKDKDGVFMVDGYITEMQDKLNQSSIDHAGKVFNNIYNMYLKDKDIKSYFAIVPDKAYFLAQQNGYLSMDYKEFVEKMTGKVEFAEYIDLFGSLSIEDYYFTDTHWRQENLTDIAELLVNGMGGSFNSEYEKKALANLFYGVYSGRVGRPVSPEEMYYLTNKNMESLIIYSYEKGKEQISLYDMNKANGKDPYDMFLSGERSIVTIENPNAKTDKELIVFRDSFGRSIIPLLTEDYAKITVIDVRYVSSSMLGSEMFKDIIEFKDGQDVLFLYSSLVLNNSSQLK